MSARLSVPTFIAEDGEFKNWLKNLFPFKVQPQWKRRNSGEHVIFTTDVDNLDSDLANGMALYFAELLEIFYEEEWKGSFTYTLDDNEILLDFGLQNSIEGNKAIQVVEYSYGLDEDEEEIEGTGFIESKVSLATGALISRKQSWGEEDEEENKL